MIPILAKSAILAARCAKENGLKPGQYVIIRSATDLRALGRGRIVWAYGRYAFRFDWFQMYEVVVTHDIRLVNPWPVGFDDRSTK